jgi:hypothetical protein
MSYVETMIFYICQTYLDENMEETLDHLESEIDYPRDAIQEVIEECIEDYK